MKTSKSSMFLKQKKRTLLMLSSGLFSVVAVSTGWVLSNSSISIKNNIVNTNSNLTGLTETTTNQNKATFSVANKQDSLNKTADQVTTSDLQNVLTPSATIQSFTVVILPVTEKNINEGYVNFLIYETYYTVGSNKTEFADASASNNSTKDTGNYQTTDNYESTTLSQYKINYITPTQSNIFSTAKINNLSNWIKASKYNLTWKTDDELKSYILGTDVTSLTPQMVWNNMLGSDSNLPTLKESENTSSNDQYTLIKVDEVDENGNTGPTNHIGLFKVTLTIYNTSTSNWYGNTFPSNNSVDTANKKITITKYFGGFKTSNGERYTVDIKLSDNIRNWTISNQSLFDGVNASAVVSSLKPSQFSSPRGGTSALISLFSSGTGLYNSSTTTSPIIQYSYASKTFNFYDSSKSNSASNESSGVIGEINKNNSNIKITNIIAIPEDSNGSLKLIFTYQGFSIYSGMVVTQSYTLEYPAGTFATSNETENLIVTWKDVNTLSQYGLNSTYDIVNEFMKNQNNTEFVRVFTNQFLNASSYIQGLNRNASIRYGSPTTTDAEVPESNNTLSGTGAYTATSGVDSKTITIRITFSNWNGTGANKVFQQSFTFNDYQYSYSAANSNTNVATGYDDALTLTWKDNNSVLTSNPTFVNTTPSSIIYNLLTSSTTSNNFQNVFVTIIGSTADLKISLIPNDENGSILMFINKTSNNANAKPLNAHIYSQLFTGFKKSSDTTGVVSYSWIPNEDVSMDLLSIPLTSVTKTDVINYYLKNISLFANSTLSEENVTISPNLSDYSLTVQVTIPLYNQDATTSTNRTFVTKITGFVKNTYTNDTTFTPPKNLTAVFAISTATIVSITLGVILLSMLLRRARIRSFKGYHNTVLVNKPKKNKK